MITTNPMMVPVWKDIFTIGLKDVNPPNPQIKMNATKKRTMLPIKYL